MLTFLYLYSLAGLYIHIPFCKKICHYCDFYKIANERKISDFLPVLYKEIELKKDYLPGEEINTIYFGGGTPSVLDSKDIAKIVELLYKFYKINSDCEITIELNPDDISFDFYQKLAELGFNRLSIGVQSFNDKLLNYLNRRHTGQEAINSIKLASDAGFKNISVDLIYGIPGQACNDFMDDLKMVGQLGVSHLSAYHLSIEDNTYFGKLIKAKKITEIDENKSEQFYQALIQHAKNQGYEQYEVSNFARFGLYSRHNTSYWFTIPYLGFGPSAHSFVNDKRLFNYPNLNNYIRAILSQESYYNFEVLSALDKINEHLLLRLRTKWGIELPEFLQMLNGKQIIIFTRRINSFIKEGYLLRKKNLLLLNDQHFFISDFIIRELFFV